MHIPDAYLSPATELVAYGLMIPFWIVGVKKTAKDLTSRQVPLLSIGAAFCFAIQMFNIPAVGGTTAHALGSTLLAVLVGPWAAMIGMTLTLTVQALMFGDGGILSLGANCFDMAVVAPFVGYAVTQLVAQRSPMASMRGISAAGIGAFVGTVIAALCAGFWLGIQPEVAHDLIGRALYCPFNLKVAIPAMGISHLLVAGPADGIITAGCISYLVRISPNLLIQTRSQPSVIHQFRVVKALLWVLALTPVGLLASGSAWGEWEKEELAKLVGYVPKGVSEFRPLIHPILPDYGFQGASSTALQVSGYLFSALIGTTVLTVFLRGLWNGRRTEELPTQNRKSPTHSLPDWMMNSNPETKGTPKYSKQPWVSRTLLKARGTLTNSLMIEACAKQPGWLQSIHVLPKAIGLIVLLLSVGLTHSILELLAILVFSLVAALRSLNDVRPLVSRVLGSTLCFSSVIIVPWLFLPSASPNLVTDSLTLICRLAAGVSWTLLWIETTRFSQQFELLSKISLPEAVVSMVRLTHRYLFVLVETVAEMAEARTSRDIGFHSKHTARQIAGDEAAVLFAKSYALTEEVESAMRSRSLGPIQRKIAPVRWTIRDISFVTATLAMLALVALGGIHAF